jgi:hypothetical protein
MHKLTNPEPEKSQNGNFVTEKTPPPTTNYPLLLLTAPASQSLRLYNYTVTANQAVRLYYNPLAAEL